MAFFRRTSSILRSALPRLQVQEQNSLLLQHDSFLKALSPFLGARFMCNIPSTKLFVGGLAWGMDENALRETFEKYGEVVEAKIVNDRDSGRSKGFGFVSYTCTDHASAAMNDLNGKTLNGRPLRVNFAIEKQRGFGGFNSYGGGDSAFGSSSGESSYGSSSFGSSPNDNSFNQGNSNFSGNNTSDQGSYDSASNSTSNHDNAGDNTPSIEDNFFGDDAFDEPGVSSLKR